MFGEEKRVLAPFGCGSCLLMPEAKNSCLEMKAVTPITVFEANVKKVVVFCGCQLQWKEMGREMSEYALGRISRLSWTGLGA